MSKSVFFEDFEIGAVEEYGDYLVTREEVLEFASRYDPQPFHLSDEGGRATHFGGLIASGWHTCAIAMRMTVDNMPEGGSGAVGSPGIDELRWTRPVYPGDRLRVRSTVAELRPSKSRPDIGIVFLSNEVYNQDKVMVMSYRPIVMYLKRQAG